MVLKNSPNLAIRDCLRQAPEPRRYLWPIDSVVSFAVCLLAISLPVSSLPAEAVGKPPSRVKAAPGTDNGVLTLVRDSSSGTRGHYQFVLSSDSGRERFTLDDLTGSPYNRRTYSLPPGVYEIRAIDLDESALEPKQFRIADASCTGATTTHTSAGVVSIAINAEATTTCSLRTTLLGSIQTILDTQPDDPTDFTFSLTGDSTDVESVLDDDSDPTRPNNFTVSFLEPGIYELTETFPSGWGLASVDCGAATTTSLSGGVKISLGDGEDVSCTFVNKMHGSIQVFLDAQPNDPADFAFSLQGEGAQFNSTLDDDPGDFTRTNNFKINFRPKGSYTISETLPIEWMLATVDCGPSNSNRFINGTLLELEQGEDAVCTFTNVPSQVIFADGFEGGDTDEWSPQ